MNFKIMMKPSWALVMILFVLGACGLSLDASQGLEDNKLSTIVRADAAFENSVSKALAKHADIGRAENRLGKLMIGCGCLFGVSLLSASVCGIAQLKKRRHIFKPLFFFGVAAVVSGLCARLFGWLKLKMELKRDDELKDALLLKCGTCIRAIAERGVYEKAMLKSDTAFPEDDAVLLKGLQMGKPWKIKNDEHKNRIVDRMRRLMKEDYAQLPSIKDKLDLMSEEYAGAEAIYKKYFLLSPALTTS